MAKNHPIRGVFPPYSNDGLRKGMAHLIIMLLCQLYMKPIRVDVGKALPTITSLKLRLLRDWYVSGGSFFYSVAQSLHALRADAPLTNLERRGDIP